MDPRLRGDDNRLGGFELHKTFTSEIDSGFPLARGNDGKRKTKEWIPGPGPG